MTTYVALLRGINVGGNNKVEMARLKTEVEALGYTQVATYINSGNVVFATKETDIAKIAKKIERVIEKTFHLSISVVVRSHAQIKKVCTAIPDEWQNNAEQKTDVMFLWEAYDSKKSLSLVTINPDVDTVKYVAGAIVWHLKKSDYNKSGMHDIIGTELYKHVTVRNVNTVRKLKGMMEQSE